MPKLGKSAPSQDPSIPDGSQASLEISQFPSSATMDHSKPLSHLFLAIDKYSLQALRPQDTHPRDPSSSMADRLSFRERESTPCTGSAATGARKAGNKKEEKEQREQTYLCSFVFSLPLLEPVAKHQGNKRQKSFSALQVLQIRP